ncbi:22876_t:CDS:1 [Cetraspora pellucida]|uniref:22876_t:CDS:1 n=1 Tax=Cetraspora pellucida TaxID=1433469 RepID=A0A9N9CHA8_9GLOM|nr:22876_t:CDS:1 [Cetraspora pellucida]
MAIQDEHERMMLLYNEFVKDNVVSTEDRAVNQYTETLWQLIEDFTTAFGYPDPTQHYLFKHAQEINQNSYIRMFNFYRNSLVRLYNILNEEIYKTKKEIAKERRTKDLVNVSAKKYLLAIKD